MKFAKMVSKFSLISLLVVAFFAAQLRAGEVGKFDRLHRRVLSSKYACHVYSNDSIQIILAYIFICLSTVV